MRTALLVGVLAFGPVGFLAAQDSSDTSGGICFGGSPHPKCSIFPMIEFGTHFRLDEPEENAQRYMLKFDLGLMHNVSSKDAIGVSAFLAVHGQEDGLDFPSTGVVFRYRRWIDSLSSVDLMVGTPITGFTDPGQFNAPSLIAGIRWNNRSWFALSAHLEHTRYSLWREVCPENSHSPTVARCRYAEVDSGDLAIYLGAEFGEFPGIAGFLMGTFLCIMELTANHST